MRVMGYLSTMCILLEHVIDVCPFLCCLAKLSMSSLPSSVSIASPAAAAQQRLLLISYSIITAIAITCFAFMIYLIVDAANQHYYVIHSNYETDGSKVKIFMEQGTCK